MFNLTGQGWLQLEELGLAFFLSAFVGAEREFRQKSAGLRTHTLVGVSAALFMLISKYGFTDILVDGRIVLDPSRVSAQIVSGIGFIGGGVIFMRRDIVRGLTTAASIWFTAALGMACGAGLSILAIATTIIHFVVMLMFPFLIRKMPRSRKLASEVQISYDEDRNLLRAILIKCTELRFAIDRVQLAHGTGTPEGHESLMDMAGYARTESDSIARTTMTLTMLVKGKRPVSHLIAALSDIKGIREVALRDDDGNLD